MYLYLARMSPILNSFRGMTDSCAFRNSAFQRQLHARRDPLTGEVEIKNGDHFVVTRKTVEGGLR